MVLLLFGTLGSVGDGAMTPLTMVILGGLMNDYGSSSPSNETVDTVNTLIHPSRKRSENSSIVYVSINFFKKDFYNVVDV